MLPINRAKSINKPIIGFTLRMVLGLNFFFVAIAHLKIAKFYTENTANITSWIANDPILGAAIAIGLLLVSLFLLTGYKTIWATLSAIILMLINHIALLFIKPAADPISGPFYNSFYHSVPFIGFAVILLYTLSTEHDWSIDRYLKKPVTELSVETKNDIVLLAARVFVGMIFFAQGLDILTRKTPLINFVKKVYVYPYENTFIPKFLLWFMGFTNPWILCLGGALLTIGFKTKWISYLLAFFMISIAFGHLMGDPFETSGDISMFGFNNLAFIILILWLQNGDNNYCIDKLLQKNI